MPLYARATPVAVPWQRQFNDMAEKNGVCVRAESFGIATSTGLPVSENSVIACKEIGIDISGKASTAVADAGIEKYEKFYCMSQSHAKMLMQFFLVQPEKSPCSV